MKKTKAKVWTIEQVLMLAGSMYALKVSVKYCFGVYAPSLLFVVDALHNSTDFIVVALLLLLVKVVNKARKDYGFGVGDIELLVQCFTGVTCLLLAREVFSSVLAKLNLMYPVLIPASSHTWYGKVLLYLVPIGEVHSATHLQGLTLVFGVVILLLCFLASRFVGNLQIRVGKECGSESVQGDGKETISDGYVELLVAVGFICSGLPGGQQLEVLFGAALGVKILFVAWEVGVKDGLFLAWAVYTHKSLGVELERGLMQSLEQEVMGLASATVRTFRAGKRAIVLVKVTTDDSEYFADISAGVKERVSRVLGVEGFEDVQCEVSEADVVVPERWCVLASRGAGNVFEVSSLSDATHLFTLDKEGGQVKWHEMPKIGREEYVLSKQASTCFSTEFASVTDINFQICAPEDFQYFGIPI